MDIFPVKFGAYEGSELVFTVESFDESCATVNIATIVCQKSWPEISAEIMKCLVAMNLEK